MGHRGSVAYVREDGSVQDHYTHWGALDARLAFGSPARRVREDNPFGEETPTPEHVDAMRDALDWEIEHPSHHPLVTEDGEPPARNGEVQPTPRGVYDGLAEWAADGVDFLQHECVYVVDTTGDEWSVRAFDTCWWKGPDHEVGTDNTGRGILVELHGGHEWCDFSSAEAMPDREKEQDRWIDEMMNWLDDGTERVPSFTPLPDDNRI